MQCRVSTTRPDEIGDLDRGGPRTTVRREWRQISKTIATSPQATKAVDGRGRIASATVSGANDVEASLLCGWSRSTEVSAISAEGSAWCAWCPCAAAMSFNGGGAISVATTTTQKDSASAIMARVRVQEMASVSLTMRPSLTAGRRSESASSALTLFCYPVARGL
jgi:hypothetical protein